MNDMSLGPLIHVGLAPTQAARLRTIAFLNLAHAIDHFVLLIFPAVVIGLEVVFNRSYAEMITLSTAAFVAFGVFSIPAGWLADRWSRRNMMALFYFGCAASLAAAGLSPTPLMLAIAMFLLGVFAAIYHPVGMAMLIDVAKARPRSLAFNGVCGNLGVTFAAGISTTLAAAIDWRAAFLVPAAICLITGIAYLALVPDDRHRIGKRSTAAPVALSPRAVLTTFGCYVAISIAGGLTFNTALIALPKLLDERIGGGFSLVMIGWLATAIFLCGAMAQLTVGRLLERLPPHLLFAGVATLQFAGVLWAGHATGAALVVAFAIAIGGHLRPDHGRRHRDGPLHVRRLARPVLCRALFPHLHHGRYCGADDRTTLRPRRRRFGAGCHRDDRLHHDGRRLCARRHRPRRRGSAPVRTRAGGIGPEGTLGSASAPPWPLPETMSIDRVGGPGFTVFGRLPEMTNVV